MPGLSIHVVDVSRGLVAEGMAVDVVFHSGDGAEQSIASGKIGKSGLLEAPVLAGRQRTGAYTVRFHIAAYYRSAGVTLPATPFLDVIAYSFGVSDAEQHYHLPMKCTPWGYSCFRGGA